LTTRPSPRTKRLFLSGKTVLLFLLLFLTLQAPEKARAADDPVTTMSVWSPAYGSGNIKDPNLTPGSVFTVNINITDAVSVTWYEMILVFDPAILQATRISFNNTIFGPNPLRVDRLQTGKVFFTVYAQSGESFSGSGVLATIDLRVLSYGSSGLSIDLDRIRPDSSRRLLHGCFTNSERDPVADFSVSPNPGPMETSAYMMGDVAVGVILPESIGYALNWTDDEVNQTLSGIREGMDWWSAQEPAARLRFSYDTHIRVPTSYEPIQMSAGQDYVWIDEVMTNLGYAQGDPWTMVRAYNNDIRSRLGTDWAFTIFVVDSGTNNLGRFAGGEYAWAYLGGPWITMSRYSGYAWSYYNYYMAVPAHEAGHIFYATDEYNTAREYSGYLSAPDNDGTLGIMNQNSLRVSTSTRRQIGWTDCNWNGVLDILDTAPATRMDPSPPTIDQPSYTLTGTAVDVPYPRTNMWSGRDISINEITTVQYSLDGSPWLTAQARDGDFNSALENFTIQLDYLTQGTHSVVVNVTNTIGNHAYATISLNVDLGISGADLVDAWPDTRALRLRVRQSITLNAIAVNIGTPPVSVQVVFQVTDHRTGTVTSVSSEVTLLSSQEEAVLSTAFTPLNITARYTVKATLHYTSGDPAPGQPGWVSGNTVSFRFQVIASPEGR